ncbi:hypothetical protein CGZ93_15625 [Enemella dayhoffiae]|uniref:Transglutaminase-like domain-containing protein n=1 Tax=Enemella dayhoffiae TaxID=2016507 RepID=A0A255GRG3_9ACTN|nr:transglutaminase-like domain-containing protein [Enemella dayhoffiae]OYO18410.1 hypothetical protein CGZ93_15625 [Enemella dayhoffiae]
MSSVAAAGSGGLTGAGPVARWVVSVLVLGLGTAALSTAWQNWAAWPLLLLAGLAGAAAAYGMARAKVFFALRLLVLALVPAIGMVLVGRQQGLAPLDALSRLVPTLLTSPFPAPVTLPLLLPGLAAVWLIGGLLGGLLTWRTFFLPPLLAGLGLLVLADLLTAGGSDRLGLVSFGLVTVVLAYWSGWSGRRRPGLPVGVWLAALLGLVALAVGFVFVGTPYQPRESVPRPAERTSEPNPLPMMGYWAEHPDEEILRRSGDTYPLHLVVLPDYDGVTFTTTSEYSDFGDIRTPLLPAGRYRKELTTTVTMKTTSRWLPAPGVPSRISVPEARIDVDTGSVISPQPPNGGVVSYTVTGSVDAPRMAELAGANVGEAERYTNLPAAPPEFEAYAKEITKDSVTFLEQTQALERALKSERKFVPTAPGGSSLPRLSTFLFAPEERGGRVGTSEQFASSFAVLARSLGIPTRVVVGFGAGSPLASDPQVNVVRGRDALAWPEVYFVDYGWVPFNPTPDLTSLQPPVEGRQSRPAPPPPVPTPNPTDEQDPPPGRQEDLWWLLPAGIGGGVLLTGLGLALARVVRRRRQQRGGAVGAWLLLRDSFRLSGRRMDPTRPAAALAADTGVPEADAVARAAEADSFAPRGEGAEVWPQARTADRALRRQTSWWRRLLWGISPAVWFQPVGRRGRRRAG